MLHPKNYRESSFSHVRHGANIFLDVTLFCFFIIYIWVFFHDHLRITGLQGKGKDKSSYSLPSASQTLRHQPGNYCRELTSAHSQQPNSNREPLVSECNFLTIKPRTLVRGVFQILQDVCQFLILLINSNRKFL